MRLKDSHHDFNVYSEMRNPKVKPLVISIHKTPVQVLILDLVYTHFYLILHTCFAHFIARALIGFV